MFAGEEDSAIEFVRETAVAATDLHGDDNEFGDDAKFGGERGVDICVAQTEADGAVGADDLEEDGEHGEGWVAALDAVAFRDGDYEEAEENVPQIERQLSSQMGTNVRGLFFVGVFFCGGAVDAEGLLFVDVGSTDGNGDGEDGDVHHDKVGYLDRRMQCSQIDNSESSCTCRHSLKPTIQDSNVDWQFCDDSVTQLERVRISKLDTTLNLHLG